MVLKPSQITKAPKIKSKLQQHHSESFDGFEKGQAPWNANNSVVIHESAASGGIAAGGRVTGGANDGDSSQANTRLSRTPHQHSKKSPAINGN